MEFYFVLKFLHIIGAAILFGTGLGIAFFMYWTHRHRDIYTIAGTARTVVLADFLFTATAALVQPVTGVMLAFHQGIRLTEDWILLSLILYVFVGACWLPVVRMQIRMRDLAVDAALKGAPLPLNYYKLMRVWFWCGWPAFLGVLSIYWLMITKPEIW